MHLKPLYSLIEKNKKQDIILSLAPAELRLCHDY